MFFNPLKYKEKTNDFAVSLTVALNLLNRDLGAIAISPFKRTPTKYG